MAEFHKKEGSAVLEAIYRLEHRVRNSLQHISRDVWLKAQEVNNRTYTVRYGLIDSVCEEEE